MSRAGKELILRAAVLGIVALAFAAEAHAAGDIRVRVKKGDLIISGVRTPSGARGQGGVHIYPTATGLRVEPAGAGSLGGEDTTINGSTEPFVTDAAIRHWRFRFSAAKGASVVVHAPEPGIPRLAPQSIVFNARDHGELDLTGVDVVGDLRFAGWAIQLADTTIGRDYKVKLTRRSAYANAKDLTVGRATRLSLRTNVFTKDPVGFRYERCTFDSLRIDTALANCAIELTDCTTAGGVRFRGDNDVLVRDSTFAGNVSVHSTYHVQTVEFENVSVDGAVLVASGPKGDETFMSDCAFGALEVRGGTGDDTLQTVRVTTGEGSRFRGAAGRADRWFTDDEELLITAGVEEIGPVPE